MPSAQGCLDHALLVQYEDTNGVELDVVVALVPVLERLSGGVG